MTWRIYRRAGDGQRRQLAALGPEDLAALGPVLRDYEKRTGLRLSEYDDARIYPDHAALLARLIESQWPQAAQRPAAVEQWRAVLDQAARDDEMLYGEGE